MTDKTKLSFQTKCIHTGNDIDKETGAIRRPLSMANSYRLPEDASISIGVIRISWCIRGIQRQTRYIYRKN